MQDHVAELTQIDVDNRIMTALNPVVKAEIRANAAYEAYAWMKTCHPFSHDNRGFYNREDTMLNAIRLHPDALYRYAMFFTKAPSEEIYNDLMRLHPPSAKNYRKFCVAARVAELEGFDISLLNNWMHEKSPADTLRG